MISAILYSVALVATFLGGALAGGALRKALQRRRPRPPELVISLGSKHQLVSSWAATRGLSPEAWAARAIIDAVPETARRRAVTADSPHMIDLAFETLDALEDQSPPNGMIFGFAPEPSNNEQRSPQMIKQVVVNTHPCAHLSGEIPPHFKAGECQGVCHAPGDVGRPCYWASNAAANCRRYAPKVRPSRVKLKPTA